MTMTTHSHKAWTNKEGHVTDALVSACSPLFIGVSNLRIERRSLIDEFLEHLQPSTDDLIGCDFPWAPRFVPGCFVSYRVLSKRVGENSMSVLLDSPYGSNLLKIMLRKARNLQRVDYTKVLYPQENNSSNQGLEIDIKHTILGQTTNYGCGAKAKTTDQPCARNPSGLLRILGSY